jgi:hypothetical protein
MAPKIKRSDKLDFNIRDFPRELRRKCQQRMLNLGKETLRDYLISVVEQDTIDIILPSVPVSNEPD